MTMTILILRKVLLHLVAILQLHLRSEISLLPASKPSHALALHTFVVALRHKMLAEFPLNAAFHLIACGAPGGILHVVLLPRIVRHVAPGRLLLHGVPVPWLVREAVGWRRLSEQLQQEYGCHEEEVDQVHVDGRRLLRLLLLLPTLTTTSSRAEVVRAEPRSARGCETTGEATSEHHVKDVFRAKFRLETATRCSSEPSSVHSAPSTRCRRRRRSILVPVSVVRRSALFIRQARHRLRHLLERILRAVRLIFVGVKFQRKFLIRSFDVVF
mmetsp:Transcript_7032/g.16058  ORF Transcript_7032/g.16058 Transcript_7032/m.16058 type:complete len:271 (-) Transcript_7032:414-1226(-)